MGPPDLQIHIDSPTYGEFLGFEEIEVTGRVSPPIAQVWVEKELVEVADDGSFSASIPWDNRYRNIDVDAQLYGTEASERIPVFDGSLPMDAWPGGMTMRFTPAALSHIGDNLGQVIDDTGWADQMDLTGIAPIDTGQGFEITPVGLAHDPTVVVLEPVEGGIEVGVELRNVVLEATVEMDVGGFILELPVSFGYEEIRVSTLATPEVDAEGMLFLTMGEGDITFGDPIVQVAGFFDASFLEPVLDQLSGLIEPVGDTLLGTIMDGIGTIPLGGPYVFNQDLMGSEVEIRLSDVFGDPAGLGAGLGVGFNESVPLGPIGMPTPVEYDEDVHLALGLHEGLIDMMVREANVVDMLSQDIVLPGMMGEMIGNGIRNLPGGGSAPEGDGWCLALEPGDAYVARLQDGIEPLGVVYLPDVIVDVGVNQGGVCESWLAASLAFEIGLVVKNGTEIGIDMDISDGAVLSYGYTGAYDEDEVVDGLGGFVTGMVGILGGQLSFDLADMFGGGAGGPVGDIPGIGEMEMTIVDSHALIDEDTGEHPEGLYSVTLGLFK